MDYNHHTLLTKMSAMIMKMETLLPPPAEAARERIAERGSSTISVAPHRPADIDLPASGWLGVHWPEILSPRKWSCPWYAVGNVLTHGWSAGALNSPRGAPSEKKD